MQHIEWLNPQFVVIPTGKDRDQLKGRKDNNELSTPTSGMIGRNHPLMHVKGTQPPLIAVPVVFVPRRELPRIHIIPGRVCDPLFADDLFSLPAATVQKELADLCHIPWPQNKTAPRIQNTPALLQPAVV